MAPEFYSFIVFALVGAFSPGPNNTLAMRADVLGGMRAALSVMIGVPTGFAVMTVLEGVGVGAVLLTMPRLSFAYPMMRSDSSI